MGQDRAGEMRAVTSGAVLCTRRGGRTSKADREKRTSEGRQAHVLHGVAARYRALRVGRDRDRPCGTGPGTRGGGRVRFSGADTDARPHGKGHFYNELREHPKIPLYGLHYLHLVLVEFLDTARINSDHIVEVILVQSGNLKIKIEKSHYSHTPTIWSAIRKSI